MGIIARIYDFVAGTKIRSAEVDAEFNQLVVGHNDHDTKINSIQIGTGIADGGIVTIKLADGSVTTIKLADLSVVAAKIALGTITLAQVNLANFDTRYYTETEIDSQISAFETKADLTTVRKLSASGDFTGTLNGAPITATDPGLSSAFAALSTDVSQRAINVKAAPYGAVGNGTTDDTAAINSAITAASAAGGGTVVIPNGNYKTTSTIIVKSNVELIMSKGAIILPFVDVDVVQIKPNARIEGGAIECTNIPIFTHAAILLDGVDGFGVLYSNIQTLIQNVRLSNSGKYTGTGIKFYCGVPTTGIRFIQFVQTNDLDIMYFNKGIEIQVDTHAAAYGSWVNGNNFDNITFTGCVTAIAINGHQSPYEAVSNRFTNIQIQPLATFSGKAIQVDGSFNVFAGMIWDWATATSPIAIDIQGNGNFFDTNITKVNYQQIKDQGYRSVITSIIDRQYDVHNPSVLGGLVMSGDQDDYLTFAMERYTVTSSVSPTGGILQNMFDPHGSFQCIWDSTVVTPIVIEVDMSADATKIIRSLQNVGVAFLFGAIAKNIKIEAFYGGAYHTLIDKTNNYAPYFNFVAESIDNVSKLKYTFSNGLTGVGIQISRIFAQNAGGVGQTFLVKDGGDLFGDVNFPNTSKGVILKDRSNSNKYRLKVTAGVLGVEIVP